MNLTLQFICRSILAAALAYGWFTLPGLLAVRLLGWDRRLGRSLAWLIAPALGLCTFAPFSLLISRFWFSRIELVAVWVVFNAAAILIDRATRRNEAVVAANRHISLHKGRILYLLCLVFGVMVAQNLVPEQRGDGWYLNEMTFDHAKVAITDVIARQGLPPINPFYTPEGQTVPLSYYYLWHFAASQLAVLADVPGWPGDVGMTWLTAVAASGLAVALAVELTGRFLAGVIVLLLSSVCLITDPLMTKALPASWQSLTVVPLLLPLWLQCIWSPHHVMGGCAVVLALMLVAEMAHVPARWRVRAVVLGLIGAAGAGSSYWVGGVALLVVSPLILMALWATRLEREAVMRLVRAGLVAGPIALVFVAPVILTQLHAPPMRTQPIIVQIWRGSHLMGDATKFRGAKFALGVIGDIVLFWVQTLPLTLGVAVVLGLPAILARRTKEMNVARTFRLIAGSTALGYLLVSQFLMSRVAIGQNDLGWRSPIVPAILLGVWASAALVELWPTRRPPAAWDSAALLVRWRVACIPLAWIGLALGLASMVMFYHTPLGLRATAAERPIHHDILMQQEAWENVRRYAGPSDRVQANPDGFLPAIHPGQLPGQLMADRPMAYASRNAVRDFAYSYDTRQSNGVYQMLARIFGGKPGRGDVRRMHDEFRVKVVLVNSTDGLWKSDALERSGYYDAVVRARTFRVYLAREHATTEPADNEP